VLGAVATAAWNVELIKTLKPGETAQFAGFGVRLEQVVPVPGPNYIAERATILLSKDGRPYTTLTPERRLFTVQRRQISETSIHTNLLRDLYATLGEGDAEKGWTIRLYWNPLAPWIWLGAGLCALGGFVSLSDRRLRIGAPRRSRATVQAAE
jgi:cytochrome c-type biogenesis protein CcmF